MIKKIFINVLSGLLVLVVTVLLEFLVTLPWGTPAEQEGRAALRSAVNREFLLTALPAALTTFVFARVLKTGSKYDALCKGIVWALMLALFYLFVGLGNNNLDLLFGNSGLYILLICAFIGPVVFAKIKRLQ